MTKNSDPQIRESARELLGKILGFRDCSPQTIEGLIAAGSLCRLGKDEALVLRGQPFDALCLIVQGSLETRIINPDGHRH